MGTKSPFLVFSINFVQPAELPYPYGRKKPLFRLFSSESGGILSLRCVFFLFFLQLYAKTAKIPFIPAPKTKKSPALSFRRAGDFYQTFGFGVKKRIWEESVTTRIGEQRMTAKATAASGAYRKRKRKSGKAKTVIRGYFIPIEGCSLLPTLPFLPFLLYIIYKGIIKFPLPVPVPRREPVAPGH